MEQRHIRDYFRNKTVLVTGGTGSFGEHVVRTLITLPVSKIIIFSRDEWKQHQLKQTLPRTNVHVSYIIGDVRDFRSLLIASRGVDVIFHAAAMKHVPISEENPMEAVYTNIYGAYNLREAAIANNIQTVVAISTDKAVRSINVMGMTKAIQERILTAQHSQTTKFICVRFGNVVGSRGSVVPIIKWAIDNDVPIPVTDPHMTRFLITLDSAMDLVFTATIVGKGREIFVKKMPACRIVDVVNVMVEHLSKEKKHQIDIVGMRQGEQMYETLISDEEIARAKEQGGYIVIYPYGTDITKKPGRTAKEYRTDTMMKMLTKEEIAKILKSAQWL
mgnify:CR=1 FL=1